MTGNLDHLGRTREQRERLQAAVVERMNQGVMVVSEDAVIQFANPALEQLFGYEPGSLTGRSAQLLSFRNPAHFAGLVRAIFQGTEDGRTATIDLEGRRSDGSLCPVQGSFSSMSLGEGRFVIAVMTDISERKQLERELMRVATRVQQRIGGDLHEGLGQHLAGIAMMLQGLGQRAARSGSNGLASEVEDIVRQVNAAVRSTRTLARGLSPVRPTTEGLNEGFAELVNQMRTGHQMPVELQLALPQGTILDETVATNLYRIAQEAVSNAARHAEATHIQVRLGIAGADVELLVTDDGRGFDPQQLARAGTGLRLMRYRAQLMGGYLAVESRPGAGTTLRCRCPLKVNLEAA